MRLAAVFLFALASASVAAPLTRDLGEGLAYHRATALPADLPAADAPRQPVVLDLRFARADERAADALASWLKSHATRATPVIVLVNAETDSALLPAFATVNAQPGLLTLGSPAAGWIPDLSIATSLDAERRAFDALAEGASLDSLLRQNTDKPRHDEAALMRELANPPEAIPDDLLSDAVDEVARATEATTPAPPPTIDFTLQRAVQLHRALVALKRL